VGTVYSERFVNQAVPDATALYPGRLELQADRLLDCLNVKSSEERVVYKRLNSTETLTQKTTTEAPPGHMYYIGLDVHMKTISSCVRDFNDGGSHNGSTFYLDNVRTQ